MAEVTNLWGPAIDPIAARFEVAAAIGGSTVHNSAGSAAMAKILRRMAQIIDSEICVRARIEEKSSILTADEESFTRG